mgnify:CR=1 FL=1
MFYSIERNIPDLVMEQGFLGTLYRWGALTESNIHSKGAARLAISSSKVNLYKDCSDVTLTTTRLPQNLCRGQRHIAFLIRARELIQVS